MNLQRWEPHIKKAVKLYGRPKFGLDRSDMRQNCYMALFRSENRIHEVRKKQGEDAEAGYVFTICRNELLENQERMRDIHLVQYFEDRAIPWQPEDRLRDALECLTPDEQDLLYGIYWYGYTASELAEMSDTARWQIEFKKGKIIRKLQELMCQ